MMEAVEDIPQSVQVSAHQSAMDEAAEAAAAVTSVATYTAAVSEQGDSHQYQTTDQTEECPPVVYSQAHYPSSSYYEAALNAAVAAKEPAVVETYVELHRVTMKIPAKVEFFGRGGSRAQVGKMVFSQTGFLALSQDGQDVLYSLPRSSGEQDQGCQHCQKNTHISCGEADGGSSASRQ